MAYKADRSMTPTARLLLIYLGNKREPQSAVEISDATCSSYWTIAELCKAMVAAGQLTRTMRGKSPQYSLPSPSLEAS